MITTNLAEIVGNLFKKNNKMLSLAESCTGGALASILVSSNSGASEWFYGSKVVYTPQTKRSWVGLSNEETVDCESEICAELLALKLWKGDTSWDNGKLVVKLGVAPPRELITLAVVGDTDPKYGNSFYIAICDHRGTVDCEEFVIVEDIFELERKERIELIVSKCLIELIKKLIN